MSALTDIFTDIANSLRSKMGTADTFKPNQMAGAINNMSTLSVIDPYSDLTAPTEYVTGFVCTEILIPEKTVATEYGPVNLVYKYNMLTETSNRTFSVTNARNLFKNNANSVMSFNYIKFGNNVTNMTGAFGNCTNFNQPVTIGNNVTNMYATFSGCANFNQPVTIPDSVTSMYATFSGCANFNQPITIPNDVIDMTYTFSGCANFNQPVTIPDSVGYMSSIFYNCVIFNQPVTIPNDVTNMTGAFGNCKNFNQPVTIPDSVGNMISTFSGCANFNQPVTIGNNVTNMIGAFRLCKNFGSSLYFKNSSKLTANATRNMFRDCGSSLCKNIYCDDATPFIQYTNNWSIVGYSVTWSSISNGYYNAYYNIYIFNDWSPA